MYTTLELPCRAMKPRVNGLTMMIDNGLPLGLFRDVLTSNATMVDFVKFGWGTAVVTPGFDRKLGVLHDLGIDFFFGGTLFEKHVAQGRFDDYVRLCHRYGARYVEASNGTLPMTNTEKAAYVHKLAGDFIVLSEVGAKANERQPTPTEWARGALEDIDAGAALVITEARESGTIGIAGGDGSPRLDVLDAILGTGIPQDRLLFEAPTKALQTYLITRLGTNVNLGNIAPADLIGVETLRLGLRSDTLSAFDAPDDVPEGTVSPLTVSPLTVSSRATADHALGVAV